MEKMNRRSFCGASVLALPVMSAFAEEKRFGGVSGESDLVLDALADEFIRTTLAGTRNGFKAEHFRQYAGQVRLYDAHLESKGTIKKLNKKLDDDDYALLDPDRTVQIAMDYWNTHGVVFDKNKLQDMVSIDGDSYMFLKKAIKKGGGFRKLHQDFARAFERSAEKYTTTAFQSGLTIHEGSLKFPVFNRRPHKNNFENAQYEFDIPELDISELDGAIDPHMFIGLDLNCLCKAMSLEGAILSILCATICPPCCVPAALMLGFVTLMKSLNVCDTDKC